MIGPAHAPRPAAPRRGFATFIAVVMVALVAVALATVAATFAHEARRARDSAARAQLGQLLLVGAEVARQTLEGGARAAVVNPPLPEALADCTLRVTLDPVADASGRAWMTRVEATRSGATAVQTLRFEPDPQPGAYRLTGVHLERSR